MTTRTKLEINCDILMAEHAVTHARGNLQVFKFRQSMNIGDAHANENMEKWVARELRMTQDRLADLQAELNEASA